MTTYQQVRRFYNKSGLSFRKDLHHYLRCGYVFSTPTCFLMGKRVGEGWFIYLAVSQCTLEGLIDFLPYYLPYVGWARVLRGRSKVVWHPTDKILRKVKHVNITPIIRELKTPKLRGVQWRGWHARSSETSSSPGPR